MEKIDLNNIPSVSCVYKIEHKTEKKFYIGYTSNLKNRLHFRGKQKGGYYFMDEPKNFDYYIIQKDSDIRKLMKLESELIIKNKDNPLLYNKTKKILEPPKILNKDETKQKFLSYINILDDTNKCWNWTGKIGTDKYGKFHIRNRKKYCFVAHRIAYYYFKNEWAGYLLVRHKCNNKLCCNPNHLELGTDQENTQDALRDGLLNYPKDLSLYKSKFSKKDVEKMIELRKQQKTIREIANLFNLDKYGDSQICNILNGKVKTLKKYLGDFDNSIYGKNGVIKCGIKGNSPKTKEQIEKKRKEYYKKNKDKNNKKKIEKQTKIILNWLANYSYLFKDCYLDDMRIKARKDIKKIIDFSDKVFDKIAIENNYVYKNIHIYNSKFGKSEFIYYKVK